jgi:hypothetical protein
VSRRDKINGAGQSVFPIHYFNSVQVVVAASCELLWLYFSPHQSPKAVVLDKTLSSFFGLQFLVSTMVSLTAPGYSCIVHGAAADAIALMNVTFFIGGSISATNMLCHRYLLERARVMNYVTNDM